MLHRSKNVQAASSASKGLKLWGRWRLNSVLHVILLFVLVAGGEAGNSVQRGRAQVANLIKVLKQSGNYGHALSLMQRSDSSQPSFATALQQILAADGATLFVPTDAAWSKLSSSMRKKMSTGNPRKVVALFQFHTLRNVYTAGKLVSLKPGTTMLTTGGDLLAKFAPPASVKTRIVVGPPGRTAGKNVATVITKNKVCDDVLCVHSIDTWLVPPQW